MMAGHSVSVGLSTDIFLSVLCLLHSMWIVSVLYCFTRCVTLLFYSGGHIQAAPMSSSSVRGCPVSSSSRPLEVTSLHTHAGTPLHAHAGTSFHSQPRDLLHAHARPSFPVRPASFSLSSSHVSTSPPCASSTSSSHASSSTSLDSS